MPIWNQDPPCSHRPGRILLLGLFAVALSACSSNIHKLDDTQQRFYRKGFSMLPPQGPGWEVMKGNHNKVTFIKKGDAPKSSYVILGYSSLHSIKYTSEEEFQLVMGKLRISMEFRPKRNVILDKKVSMAPEIGEYCLKSYSKMKDFGKYTRHENNYLMRENFGLVCLHPDDKSQLVNFAVSYRYPPGAEDKEIGHKAEQILAGIRLEPLGDEDKAVH